MSFAGTGKPRVVAYPGLTRRARKEVVWMYRPSTEDLSQKWAAFVATRDPRFLPNCGDVAADNEQKKLVALYSKLNGIVAKR